MTNGERRFAHRIVDKLEQDYLGWYDVPIGPRSLHPDFVILHPRRGLLVLEVKDWRRDSIRAIDRNSVTLITSTGDKVVANPLEQARQYAQAISDLLQKDPLLVVSDGGKHQGRLSFPYGYGVVLANIHRKAFDDTDLGDVIDGSRVICQDEMFEAADVEDFQKRLWGMFTVTFPAVMSMPQIDRVRWHLFPEIRIRAEQLPLIEQPGTPQTIADAVPDLMKVMDLHQEQLARSLGAGHRVIHGVAGSGKTLILGYRCERLAGQIEKPILVLCFNVTLASKLQDWMKGKSLDKKVNVRTFHAWCRDQLILYNVELPESGERFFDELVERVISAVERGQIPPAQYGAVLIDEGHDFREEWLRIVAQMVDPETNSLLVLYDDAQSIYGESKKRKFSFSSVGIQAKGRTTILKLNYRNTTEVLSVAYEFAREAMVPKEAAEDDVPLVEPQTAGRRGPVPELTQLKSLEEEGDFIAKMLLGANRNGLPWREMAVLYRSRFVGEKIVASLRKAGVPAQWLDDPKEKKKLRSSEDSIKAMTMHSSKGLEFSVVAIPGLGYLPVKDADEREEAKLLYVAMTRAMNMLLLTAHRQSDFVVRLRSARDKAFAIKQIAASKSKTEEPEQDAGLDGLFRFRPLDDERPN